MNEEINNILELSKDDKNLHHKKGHGGLLFITLSMIQFSKLKRYIKELQQENQRLKLIKKENDTLKKRIKDAIEYNQEDINQIKEFYKSTHEIIYSGDAIIDIAKITIAILKGKKNE